MMNYIHAFCILFGCVVGFDYVTFQVKGAPARAMFKMRTWMLAFALGVFELGWWFFR